MPKTSVAVLAVLMGLSGLIRVVPAVAMPAALRGEAQPAAPIQRVTTVCGVGGCVPVYVKRVQRLHRPMGMGTLPVAAAPATATPVVATAPTVASNPLATFGSTLLQKLGLSH